MTPLDGLCALRSHVLEDKDYRIHHCTLRPHTARCLIPNVLLTDQGTKK